MTDHPSALVSVPVEPTEAMLDAARGLIMSLSFGVPNHQTSLNDVARSGYYGELWSHVLTEEERAMTGPITKAHRAQLIYRAMLAAAPAAPQAAGVGEAWEKLPEMDRGFYDYLREIGVLDGYDQIVEWSDIVTALRQRDINAEAEIEALRAPSREPEGGAVDPLADWTQNDGVWGEPPVLAPETSVFVLRRNGKVTGPYPVGRIEWHHQNTDGDPIFYRPADALATREEAPAEAGELSEAMERLGPAADFLEGDCVIVGDHEVRGNDLLTVLSALRAQPPAREDGDYDLGKRDGYEQAVQDIDLLTGGDGEYVFATDGGGCPDAEAMKTRIVERFHAREDAQPVAWMRLLEGQVTDLTCIEREGYLPLYFHPAPDALREAVDALLGLPELKARREHLRKGIGTATGDGKVVLQALAALQAEQKGGA